MGHAEMWRAMRDRDAIYADAEADDEDFLRSGGAGGEVARKYGGYTSEARAGELLLGLGVAISQHGGPMARRHPGWKLRVLLAQALFGDPDILLLDEPTNNLDINSNPRWLEDVLNQRSSTMVIISQTTGTSSPPCARTWPTWTTAASRSTRATTTTTWKRRPWRSSSSRKTTRKPRTASRTWKSSCGASAPTRPRRARRPRA